MATAIQKPGSDGGVRSPVTPAMPVNSSMLMPACTASASGIPAEGRVRRSMSVAPTRHSIAAAGSAYAQAGAPPFRSPPTTSATPASPAANPAACRPVIRWPRTGTARTTAAIGWSAVIRSLTPALTPCCVARKTP